MKWSFSGPSWRFQLRPSGPQKKWWGGITEQDTKCCRLGSWRGLIKNRVRVLTSRESTGVIQASEYSLTCCSGVVCLSVRDIVLVIFLCVINNRVLHQVPRVHEVAGWPWEPARAPQDCSIQSKWVISEEIWPAMAASCVWMFKRPIHASSHTDGTVVSVVLCRPCQALYYWK
jgi:hypothetical protein